jgi:hypothetical protein
MCFDTGSNPDPNPKKAAIKIFTLHALAPRLLLLESFIFNPGQRRLNFFIRSVEFWLRLG